MYTAFYNLREPPFRLTPDPRFLFLSDKHREALAHLIFSIRQGSGFAVITGEIGTGKTTLIRTMLRDAESDTLSAYVFNPSLTGIELLQTINQEFGLPVPATTKELVDSLNRFLLEQKRAGKNVVVIVDEAQALSPQVLEQLRLLSNLETETEKLLQIILVGQPELGRLLSRPELTQLKQRVSITWHLRALDRRQSAVYVRHRISVACAGAKRRIFTAGALAMIYAYSRGIPRTINIICDRALLIGYTMERQRLGTRTVRRAVRELAMEGAHKRWSLARSTLVSGAVAAVLVAALVALTAGDRVFHRAQLEVTSGAELQKGARRRSVASQGRPTRRVEATPASPASKPALGMGTPAAAENGGSPQLAETTASELAPDQLVRRLTEMSRHASAISAVNRLLELWNASPLDPQERQLVPIDLAGVASRRGLELLPVSGTWERLRLLNLPAILELVLGEAHQRRLVSLLQLDEDMARLASAENGMVVSLEDLNPLWHGDANVLWRDYEELPPLLARGASGASVARLSALLDELGMGRNLSQRHYDWATERSVAEFQRQKGISVDGVVGPLTKILLYGSAPRYTPPRLNGGEEL